MTLRLADTGVILCYLAGTVPAADHAWAVAAFEAGPLVTCEAVLTEAAHFAGPGPVLALGSGKAVRAAK